MPIESAVYTQVGSVVVTIDGQEFAVPDDPRNRHMQELNVWLAAGNIIAPVVIDLADVKAKAKAEIDRKAEDARLKYITGGSGQALEYKEVADEAVRYVATSGAGLYPMLQASVDAGEAPDLAAAAALITSRENAWATIGANIRRLRLTAKRGIEAATTVEQVQAAATVTWP